jgi:hypothetical protein
MIEQIGLLASQQRPCVQTLLGQAWRGCGIIAGVENFRALEAEWQIDLWGGHGVKIADAIRPIAQ